MTLVQYSMIFCCVANLLLGGAYGCKTSNRIAREVKPRTADQPPSLEPNLDSGNISDIPPPDLMPPLTIDTPAERSDPVEENEFVRTCSEDRYLETRQALDPSQAALAASQPDDFCRKFLSQNNSRINQLGQLDVIGDPNKTIDLGIFEKLKNLQHLVLKSGTFASLKPIGAAVQIKNLSLGSFDLLKLVAGFEFDALRVEKLEINLAGVSIADRELILKQITTIPNLSYLTLRDVDGAIFAQKDQWARFKKLDTLALNFKNTRIDCSPIKSVPNLRALALGGEVTFSSLLECIPDSVRFLNVTVNEGLSYSGTLRVLPNLETITLQIKRATLDTQALAPFKMAKKVYLLISGLASFDLVGFREFSALESFNIWGLDSGSKLLLKNCSVLIERPEVKTIGVNTQCSDG